MTSIDYSCCNTTTLNHFIFYILIGYEMKQLTLQLKLSTLRSQFQQAFAWIDQIPLKKWIQAYDEGRRYDHMTTNLAECMNFVLKGARSLSICALVKTTFEITKSWFVEWRTKTGCMLWVDHQYPKDIIMCHVQRYNRQNSKFDVQELPTPQLRRLPMSYTVRLNDRWCDYGEFQALWLSCAHIIIVCLTCHLQLTTFVDSIYNLQYILKAYEVQFHLFWNQDYSSTYMRLNFIPDPYMHCKKLCRPTTNRIHNKIDESFPNRTNKCFLCRNKDHNRANCPYRQ